MTIRICKGCGNEFEVGYYKQKQHCNRTCWMKRYNKEDLDEHGLRGAKAGGQANIEKLRGTGTKTYVKEYNRHQHLVVAERELLGRPLQKGEIVHHEDHNKKNNDPRNLIVFPSQGEHARHHFLGHTEGRNLPCNCTITKKLT